MCYFTCSAPEIIHSHCFYLISNKSKMVIMRPPAAPPPIKYTSSCREDQRCSTEGKIVSKYCNLSKTQGEGGSIPPPYPTPLCHGGGMALIVRLRVRVRVCQIQHIGKIVRL